MYTHRILLHTFNGHNLLGEAGKQNNVLLLERERVKLCVKVKGVEAQMAESFGKLLHLCGVVCYSICCSGMVECQVQSVFGIIICIIQFGINYEAVTYFGSLYVT